MTRINISITDAKTIERVQRISTKIGISYTALVAIAINDFDVLQHIREKKQP